MIRFSIIIPHHDIPELLKRCLLSIPDREDIQVIVVDDNSQDDQFLRAIEQVDHQNVEVYVTTEGRGAGYVRNVGLQHAKGEWLLFADADDLFVDDFYVLINQYADSEADVIYFNTRSCLSNDLSVSVNRNKDNTFERYRQTKDERLFRFCYPEPWGKMIRRELVDRNHIQFDETMVSNDYLFSVKIGYFAKTILTVDVPLYFYTFRDDSLTSDDNVVNIPKLKARLDAYIHVQSFMQSIGYHSTPALSSHILVPLFKNYNTIYRAYWSILRANGLPLSLLFRDTLRHYWRKLVGKPNRYGDVYSIIWKSN